MIEMQTGFKVFTYAVPRVLQQSSVAISDYYLVIFWRAIQNDLIYALLQVVCLCLPYPVDPCRACGQEFYTRLAR